MPGKRQYVIWVGAAGGYLMEGERVATLDVAQAARFGEGVGLDIVVERANLDDPSKGVVLMLAPECRSL